MKFHLAAVAVLLALVACTSGGSDQRISAENFRQGGDGLRIAFTPNVPPDRLYDSEDFAVLLDIENLGAFDIGGPGDRIYLSGFDNRLITGLPSQGVQIPQLEGKNQFNPQGARSTVSFKGRIGRITGDVIPQPIQATACYRYRTEATANVCIDPDPYSTGVRPVSCTPSSPGLGTQAAPIAVSAIAVEPRPGKTGFRVTVSNVGGGSVFRNGPDTLGKCNPQDRIDYNDIDYVEITDVTVGGSSIRPSCTPLDRGHVRLTSGSGQLYCEFVATGRATFTTPITVTLTYGYRQTIQRALSIISTENR